MLQKQLFEIKFNSKQFERQARKAEKKAAENKIKLKQAIEKRDDERAKMYAEEVIRQNQQANSLLKLATRMERVAARLETAINMKNVTKVSLTPQVYVPLTLFRVALTRSPISL